MVWPKFDILYIRVQSKTGYFYEKIWVTGGFWNVEFVQKSKLDAHTFIWNT